MHLTLFGQVTYVNVLHWMVGLSYSGVQVNGGISLILFSSLNHYAPVSQAN